MFHLPKDMHVCKGRAPLYMAVFLGIMQSKEVRCPVLAKVDVQKVLSSSRTSLKAMPGTCLSPLSTENPAYTQTHTAMSFFWNLGVVGVEANRYSFLKHFVVIATNIYNIYYN